MRKPAAILLCLALVRDSWAAVTFVQCQSQYPVSTGVTINTTAGNMLVAWKSTAGSTNFTCSDGHNTYVQQIALSASVNGTQETIDGSYALNIAGGSETVNCGATGNDDGITVCEFSGVGSFDVSSTTVSGAGATTTPTMAAFTTTADGLVVVYYANESSGSEVTAGTGYTIDANRNSNHYDGMQYKVNVTAGSQTPFFTVTSNNNWMMGAMAFTAAGGGGGSATGSINTQLGTGSVNTESGTGSINSVR